MIVYTANYGNFEPIQDVTGLATRANRHRFIMFTDGQVPIQDFERKGWHPIVANDPNLTPGQNVRRVKFLPDQYADINGPAAVIDGSVVVNREFMNILSTISSFTTVKPLNVTSWYDELLRVFICKQANSDDLLELAHWVNHRANGKYRPFSMPMTQTKMIWRDFSNPKHVQLGQQFWDIYSMFPNIQRDQNILPLALADLGIKPNYIEKRDYPHLFEPKGHMQARRVRNVYHRDDHRTLDQFILELAKLTGSTVPEFLQAATSEQTLAAHHAKARMYEGGGTELT